MITFISTDTEKMRRQQLVTNAIPQFNDTNRFKEKGIYCNSGTLKMTPTDSIRESITQLMSPRD